MKKNQSNIIREEEAGMRDIFLRRPFIFKFVETLLYVFIVLGVLTWIPGNRVAAILVATVAAIIIVGFAPAIYKAILHPLYQITRTDLIIHMFNKQTKLPLHELQRDSIWKPVYRANGKKYTVMASREFLADLDRQIERRQKRGKV
ncbi:hypothetical protein [Aneurinibacillus tyrosinisolvens]|jgi:hypothetical protein|uniref:hypothetical protein n=1 Tax=Aneurinibacillus tyrosinisolvens TaxID=1443435 RepID=UPI00063F572D|nr:hypothetical protein [Aneurinibacillus tyrosinisolvens]